MTTAKEEDNPGAGNLSKMINTLTNICCRCGKVRVAVKTYQEVIGNSLVTTVLTTCPDHKCQVELDKQLAKEQKYRDELKVASEKRDLEAKKRKAEKQTEKN